MNTNQEYHTNTESHAEPVSASVPESHIDQTNQPINAPQPFYKNIQLLMSVFVAILVLSGALYFVSTKDSVVAVVNGEKIYQSELAENIKRMQDGAQMQGVDISSLEIQQEIYNQSIQMLIDNALLLQAAAKLNITVDSREVELRYNELLVQVGGEDELISQLALINMTVAQLKENIYDRVLVDKYLEEVTDIEELTVSDEDVASFLSGYDPETLPPLDTIRSEIEAQILSQKRQEVLSNLIQELRDSAVIEQK